MQVFPASIPLDGRTVIVVGRGPMAEPKVRLFAASPARLLWFTGNTDDPVPADIAQYARIERRMPTRRDLRGATLLFIAGGDGIPVDALARTGRRLGIPVNIVDSPSASDFQTKYRVAGVNLEQSEVQNIINAVDYVCRWDNRNNELRYDLI